MSLPVDWWLSWGARHTPRRNGAHDIIADLDREAQVPIRGPERCEHFDMTLMFRALRPSPGA